MIDSERTQNLLVLFTIIVSLISVFGLVSSSSYYSGSYQIIRELTIDLENVYVSNVDPGNETINPSLSMHFNILSPQTGSGKATITFLRAQVFLNGKSFQYAEF